MNILITGAQGQLGYELTRCFAPLGRVLAFQRGSLDLTNPNAIRTTLHDNRPDLIVNAGAYTAVDQAEDDFKAACDVNAEAPGLMASYAAENDIPLIHYSTDYVFNGQSSGAYQEDHPTDPVNRYGESKLLGEQAIQQSGCRYWIFRTSWVYAARGKNFLLTMLKLAQNNAQLKVVDDQTGTPTWARMLAQLTATAFCRAQTLTDWNSGIYHVSSTGQTTWHGFASLIFEQATSLGLVPQAPVCEAVTSDTFPTRAQRPKYSMLNNDLFSKTFDLNVPSWQQQLIWCLQDLSD